MVMSGRRNWDLGALRAEGSRLLKCAAVTISIEVDGHDGGPGYRECIEENAFVVGQYLRIQLRGALNLCFIGCE